MNDQRKREKNVEQRNKKELENSFKRLYRKYFSILNLFAAKMRNAFTHKIHILYKLILQAFYMRNKDKESETKIKNSSLNREHCY